MEAVESVLGGVSFLAPLRPDEIGKIARRFELATLPPEATRTLGATAPESRLLVVISGIVDLSVDDPTGEVRARLRPGDRYGDADLLAGHARAVTLRARRRSCIALLDRAGLDAVLREYPVVALPLASELASEVRTRNDQVRQILELAAGKPSRAQLEAAIRSRRRTLAMSGAAVRRLSPGALFRRLVVERGSEPPFWMLIGFLASLAGARLVVFLILKYKLEKQLFALVAGTDPNPMHIHHFNYGLIIASTAGLAALLPFGRRTLRLLAALFGIGCGLIFDEFALFWNLNPDYSQGLSLISAAIAALALVQLTYFRAFWLALIRRLAQATRGE